MWQWDDNCLISSAYLVVYVPSVKALAEMSFRVDFQKSQVNLDTDRLTHADWLQCLSGLDVEMSSFLIILVGQVEQELTPRTGLDPTLQS